MIKEAHGVVRGKSIELSEDLGLVDGDQVKLTVEPVPRRGNPYGDVLSSEQ